MLANANKERPTIGLLVDLLEDRYQNTVLRGVADAAAERETR